MRSNRLSVVLSASALAVALLGVTPAGEAARGLSVAFAKNAGKLGGFKPSKTSRKNTVVVRGANGKIDAASVPVIRGERGLQGSQGPAGPQGPQGPEGPPNANAVSAQNADKLDGLDSTHFAALATVQALETRVAQLEAKLAAVSYDDANDLLRITGANVQIVDGSGTTDGTPNALGNLIVGYNADPAPAEDRGGSHNLIVGDDHTYSSFAGAVFGSSNAITAASVLAAGSGNTASGGGSSVTGGTGNTASGGNSSVTAGNNNLASGIWSSITAGANNTANAGFASVSGGSNNLASNNSASVAGGSSNSASGFMASVSGGHENTAAAQFSSVSGGDSNATGGVAQWLGGTLVTRQATTTVAGGAEGNGDYATADVQRACDAGHMLVSGGAFWDIDDDTKELPLIYTRPNAALTGWWVRGGNDTSATRTLTVQALCLGP